jgi:hypothetical protein
MKTIICLAILSVFVISSVNAADLITENTNKFFIGTWYPTATDPASFKRSKCCVPFGHVEFHDTSSNKVTLSASQWVGTACTSPNSRNSLVFTLNHDISYAKFFSSTKNLWSTDAVQMSVRNFNGSDVHASNNTQKVTFDLRLNYVQRETGGVTCAVTLSKAGTPVVPTTVAPTPVVSTPIVPDQESSSSDASLETKNNDIDTVELVQAILLEFKEKYSSESKFLSYFD